MYCQHETAWKDVWLPDTSPAPTKCPVETGHSVDPESISVTESITQNDPKTPDNRTIVAVNTAPPGYSLYFTSKGDDIAQGKTKLGPRLLLDSENPAKSFQLLEHFYIIGGRAKWEGAKLDDSITAVLMAPKTEDHSLGGDEDYLLANTGLGGNILIPTPAGTGTHGIDLAAKKPNTNILKAVPVPAPNADGWFDYDSESNELSKNMDQKGLYNLFDFDIPLFTYVNELWGSDNSKDEFELANIVGKLMLNCWRFDVIITPQTQGARCGISMTVAVKSN